MWSRWKSRTAVVLEHLLSPPWTEICVFVHMLELLSRLHEAITSPIPQPWRLATWHLGIRSMGISTYTAYTANTLGQPDLFVEQSYNKHYTYRDGI